MKITFEVPDSFEACVFTCVLLNPDDHTANLYTVTKTKNDFEDGTVKCYPFDYNEKSD